MIFHGAVFRLHMEMRFLSASSPNSEYYLILSGTYNTGTRFHSHRGFKVFSRGLESRDSDACIRLYMWILRARVYMCFRHWLIEHNQVIPHFSQRCVTVEKLNQDFRAENTKQYDHLKACFSMLLA